MFLQRAWSEVDLDLLVENYRKIQAMVPPKVKLMAVLKANAYSCGDLEAARTLEQFSDDWYAVSNLNEAVNVRSTGSKKPILILGYTAPDEAEALVQHNITQTIVSFEHAMLLADACKRLGKVLNVHIKLDTGMGRLGLKAYDDELEISLQQAKKILEAPSLHVSGIFTHFSCLYELDSEADDYSEMQYQRFVRFTDSLSGQGYDVGLRHCLSSAGIVNVPQYAMDMVRPGVLLYGALPDYCKRHPVNLAEVLTVKAAVSHVKQACPGMYIGYSKSYKAVNEMTIATITIGYSDILRMGAGEGKILVNGRVCPVVGGVCMDQLMVDVTNAGQVCVGDVVVVLGKMGDSQLTVNDLSEFLQTDGNEVYCHMTKRLPIVHYKKSKPISWTEYEAAEHII